MAVSSRVASRYSKALIALAQEKGAVDAIKDDMSSVVKLYEESKDFSLFVESPIVAPTKKQEIFKKIFNGKVNAITSSFFDLVIAKGRENGLYDIAKSYLVRYNDVNGIQSVEFFTADEVSDAIKNEISSSLGKSLGKKIQLKTEVKEDLIGGYILRVGDKQIDSSVKGSLQKLRNEFVK